MKKTKEKLLENPHMKRSLIQIGLLKGEARELQKRIRRREILRGHLFIDGNKRTAFMVYMLLTTKKSYEEILKDYYDIFLSLSK